MTREELIKMVALKMDEISSSDEVVVEVGLGDNNPMYAQINGLLNETINDVLMKAPVFRLDSQAAMVDFDSSVEILGKKRLAAKFNAPADFLRLVSITDPLFARPIVDFSIEGDDIDKRQRNQFLVAKYAKPVAVISTATGHKVITCYSYDLNDKPAITMVYIKRFRGSEDDLTVEVNIDGYLADIISWACAGKVFATRGDIEKVKTCDENASALMI